MIKRICYSFIMLLLVTPGKAQQRNIDSLRHEKEITQNDTININLLNYLTEAYTESKPDSAFYFAEQLLMLARKLNLKLIEGYAQAQMGYALLNLSNYPRSLQTLLSAQAIVEDPKTEHYSSGISLDLGEFLKKPVTPHARRISVLSRTHQYLGILYGNTSNNAKELFHFLESLKFAEQTGNVSDLCTSNLLLGRLYLTMKKPDSALIYEQKAYDISIQTNYKKYLGSILLNLGRIQTVKGNKQLATGYFREAIHVSIEQNYLRGAVAGNLLLADLYKESGKKDSSLLYANAALAIAQSLNSPSLLLRSYTALAAFYKFANNNDSIAKYQELIIRINDSLFNSKQVQQFQNIDFDEQQRQQEIEAAKEAYQNRLQRYLLLAGLAIFLLVVIFLWRSNRHRQKTNFILQQQKKELEMTLTELKNTQAQLIQSEKMASLGELTAGIAHEIQNPLNFINNFSEVNKELLEEMKGEIDKGNVEEVKAIANDIIENEEKINHHGKRADAIVKGMLQHSRISSGVREPTNINALADEYLRLAYHGFRAKAKSFNAKLDTNYDETIENVNIIPQDIGRVILNLITNAFYAVTEKKKLISDNYEPCVSVTTKNVGGKVEIRVKDNGNGIPQKILDKIFQPFFTTKPTGQGTGLGLSLSYDIIKAHSGELKVETIEGEGAEFIIQLPIA